MIAVLKSASLDWYHRMRMTRMKMMAVTLRQKQDQNERYPFMFPYQPTLTDVFQKPASKTAAKPAAKKTKPTKKKAVSDDDDDNEE